MLCFVKVLQKVLAGMQRSNSHEHLTYYNSKRNVMKKYVLLLGLLIQAVSALAQEASTGKSVFSVYAGPSWYLGRMIGITNNSGSYRSDLRNGVTWDASFYFLGDKYIFNSFKFAPGLLYQGGQYKNAYDESSDKILMHYIAPQIALFMVKQKYNLSLSTGLGYQHYKDKSIVYGKPRDVSMNKLAYNLSAGGEYLLSSLVGISAKVNWIVTSSESYSVKYHGRKWQVESPELNGGGGCFSQLSLLFGINLHF